jgi:hypothetical protein
MRDMGGVEDEASRGQAHMPCRRVCRRIKGGGVLKIAITRSRRVMKAADSVREQLNTPWQKHGSVSFAFLRFLSFSGPLVS